MAAVELAAGGGVRVSVAPMLEHCRPSGPLLSLQGWSERTPRRLPGCCPAVSGSLRGRGEAAAASERGEGDGAGSACGSGRGRGGAGSRLQVQRAGATGRKTVLFAFLRLVSVTERQMAFPLGHRGRDEGYLL